MPDAPPDTSFELHPQLAADTVAVGDWPLSRVLLMNDAHYPWLVLVPRRAGVRELYELGVADQLLLLQESLAAGQLLMTLCRGHKLNVAALGNVVPQLHVHHVVRQPDDAAWPAPVWGRHPAQPYAPEVLRERLAGWREALDARWPLR